MSKLPLLLIRASCLAFLTAAPAALAADLPEPLSVPVTPRDAFELHGDAADRAEFSRVNVQGQSFSTAVRVKVPKDVGPFWGVQVRHTVQTPIAKGDTLWATFSLRCIESMTGEGQAQLDFEENSEPYDKSVSQVVYAPATWESYEIPFTAAQDYQPGTGQVAFQLGFEWQTIELGGFTLTNFGPDVPVADLPRTRQTYPGIEEDAAWRAAADERIDEIRKADLTVEVVDAKGAPVEGAVVRAEMLRHAFPFGTAVTAELLTRTDPTSRRYQQEVERRFNAAVFENDHKWNNHGVSTPSQLDAALEWLVERGIETRGHVLLWPSWQYIPGDSSHLHDDPAALREAIRERIRSAVTTANGRLVDWDVVNETYTNHQFQDLLGEAAVTGWFEMAKVLDPDVNLYINDYGILTAGSADSAHQQGYFDQITRLLEAGAPLEGIGMQGHFAAQLTGPERLLEIVDRYAVFGLPIKVTEFDVNSIDLELQASYLRDFYTALFSHEAIDGITMWGFWANAHWRPEAAMLNPDFSPRPHAEAYQRLVFGDWWTKAQATTNQAGTAEIRGFQGVYEVSVEHDGVTRTLELELPAEGSTVSVPLTETREPS